MPTNFGDFQNEVYAEAVKGVTTRYPFDFASIERKASEALPDWVYRYVSAAAGDGRTQRANIAAFSCYGIVPRMMVSPPERDLSISLFGKHLASPMFLAPIGLVGLCAPDFHGDVAAAQASAATGVPYTLSTFTQTRMEDVVPHAGDTPIFYQLYLPDDRELAASLINGATAVGLGRPYAYALSYGGAESLTHYLLSFLAELDLCLAVCGFKDIATLKEAGVQEVINSRELLPG